MICLFIDTSGIDVSIGIVKDNKILAYISECVPNKHSVYTTSYIKKMLDCAKIEANDIDKILVVNGPGSFTGVRIGVTIAKVYAYLLKKDIVCVSSLRMLALSSSIRGDYYLSLIDAKHDNYYIGLYDKDYNFILEEFNSKDFLLGIINKYNPVVISNTELQLIDSDVVNLDILSIVNYYKDMETINSHLVNPNYLKLPQVLEKND